MSNPQLFCLTHAGGTASFYDVIEKDLCGVECVKLEYSGHGRRHKEPFYNDFNELAEDMLKNILNRYDGREYGLFGYSMGSIAIVEVLRILMSRNIKKPDNIFLAAHEPKTRSEFADFSRDELDNWVMNRTIEFGAVPEKLINNPVFWRTYLPIYRADYSIIGKYDFDKINMKAEIPTTVFYSETDTPLSDMEKWGNYFPCEFHQFTGKHFFIEKHHEEMAKIIREKMGVGL